MTSVIKLCKVCENFCSSSFGSEKKIISKPLSIPTVTQALPLIFLTFLPIYRHIKKMFFIFYIKDFVALTRNISLPIYSTMFKKMEENDTSLRC